MNKEKVEIIKDKGNILAIIIYEGYKSSGVNFFTPPEFSQQLAFISKKKNEVIDTHIHNPARREVSITQETLLIKKGKVRVDLYDSKKKYLDSRVLKKGDVILLASGGHGFKAVQNLEMVEIKQGPYLFKDDKERFKGFEK